MKEKKANPQGKGLVPVVSDLHSKTGLNVQAKSWDGVSTDLFTSLFVLGSKYSFKPILGKSYYLYLNPIQNTEKNTTDDYLSKMWLSLLSPKEWGEKLSGFYIGRCSLEKDYCWSIELNQELESENEVWVELLNKKKDFDNKVGQLLKSLFERESRVFKTLDADGIRERLKKIFPFHNEKLNYYARVGASILSYSLVQSLEKQYPKLIYSETKQELR